MLTLLLLAGLSGCEATEAAERVALVIGNGNYAERPLRRPVQDAGDMAALLKKLGFTVTVATELTLEQMESRVQEFVASARTAEVRLFYYSGHGANYQDHSYLLPVGHGINRAYDMKRKAYPLDALLDGLKEDAPGGVNVVLLDACRDEPFGSQSKSVGGGKGLIPVATAGAGTLVAYAAGSGEQAMELAGDRNSLFTKYLLQRLKEPEEIRLVLTQVRAGVKKENPTQVTETSDKLDQRLYLAGEPGKDSEQPPVAAPAVDHDLIAWQSAEKCGTAACFRAYMEDYPKGRYARMAKARLEPESKPEPESRPVVVATPTARPAAKQRFTDNDDGTITDNKTGLIWLKNANCFGGKDWSTAMNLAKRLQNGQCDLRDGSGAGQWRLPSREEWKTLIDTSTTNPALPVGYPFTGVQSYPYWSSTNDASDTNCAWGVYLYGYGDGVHLNGKTSGYSVWPVRGGR